MEVLKALVPILGPVIAAILGSIGLLLKERRQSSDTRYRRTQARVEATEMVTFIDKWIQAQQLACSPKEFEQAKQMARQQLERIYSALSQVEQVRLPTKERPFLQRLLLLYRPAGVLGWVLHLIFYLLVIFYLLLLPDLTAGVITDMTRAEEAVPLWFSIVFTIIFNLILLLPVLGVRAWARSVDVKQHKLETTGTAPSSELTPQATG